MASGPRSSPPALMPMRTFTAASSGARAEPRARRPASSTSWWVTKRTMLGRDGVRQHPVAPPGAPAACPGSGWANVTMLVRTAAGSSPHVGPALRHRFGQARRPGVVLGQARRPSSRRATRPGAASTPAWRMPPPSRLRASRAAAITSSAPASSEPTGAHSPLDRQHMTVVAGGGPRRPPATPVATSALNSRAPSMWTGTRPGGVDHRGQPVHRPGRPRRRHVRVLDADERHRGLMVRGGLSGPRTSSARACRPRRRRATNCTPALQCRRAVLVGHDVLAPPRHHRRARPREHPQGDLVGHDARRHEERGRPCPPARRTPPRARGRSGPRRSRRHRPRPRPWRGAWPGVGPGDGVAAQVDHVGHAAQANGAPLTFGGDHAPVRPPATAGAARRRARASTSSSTSRSSRPGPNGWSCASR